jgi:hypothetical protein
MKKTLLALSLIIATFILFGQQVERDKVLLEIGTGTWCTYCPGAAMGADDLIANGHPVAVIEYHNGDNFANTYSNARNSYYGISSFPTAKFDGIYTVVGGSHNQSMYSSYLPYVNLRADVPSSFIVDVYGNKSGSTYDMVAIIQKVAPYTGPNPIFHLAITESHIPYVWQGQSELNFVCRQMVPDQYGTTVSFSESDTVILNMSFTMGGWVLSHVEFVGFLQNNTSKEVLQATKRSGVFLPAPPEVPVTDFTADATSSCEGYEVHFTDMSANYPTEWLWTFPGGTPETSTEENPVVVYENEGVYDVTLVTRNIMGSHELSREDYMEVSFIPEQPSISMTDYTLISSSEEGNQWYLNGDTIIGATSQSYTPIENGTYALTVTNGNCTSVFSEGYDVIWVGIEEQYALQSLKVYPIPSQGRFSLELNATGPDKLNLKVYNSMQTLVYEEDNIMVSGAFKKQLDLGHLSNGIYFMVLEGSKGQYLQKLVIRK